MIDRPSEQSDTLTLTLPDGSQRTVARGTSPTEVVRSIGERLLRDAIAVEINGEVRDLATPLRESGTFRVLTAKDPRSLDVLRHSAAHVLATAVRRVRPEAKIGFGPSIDEGFYYDFEVERPFTPEDLAGFEEEMRKVVADKFPFVREEVSRAEAQKRFVDDPLKLERLSELGEDDVISTYTDGPFLDLCKGPHVPDTSYIKNFKLLNTAGAYWRGDEKRQMLQRIYGTAWWKKEDLDAYLHRLEEAKRRDHRVLGQQLDLFSADQRVGPGLILWHPRGAAIRNEIENFERELILRHGYDLVYTPHIVSEKLFEISGHLVNFKDAMFGAMDVEGAAYRPKPMNCPGHICIYQSKQRSYRDLPIRYAEFGTVYRYERSGVLHGMLRVRGFTQDDAHVFCTPQQVDGEIERLLDLVTEMLAAFGYPWSVELSTRPENALGDPATWERAQDMLAAVMRRRGIEFVIDEGGGAFYGPKLDFKLIDAIGRKWQGPTVQLDFNLPERFALEFVGEDNARHRPVMLHRVLVGSMERFVGGLIEHYAGNFPLWLSPEHAWVIPMSAEANDAAAAIAARFRDAGLRAHYDTRGAGVDAREQIKEAARLKVPYMAIVGRREAEAGTVTLRVRGADKRQATMSVDDAIERLVAEKETRAQTLEAVPATERIGAPA